MSDVDAPETDTDWRQERLDQLALNKAALEVKNLRNELYLKPVGLLTPVLLAVGIYFLVQGPANDLGKREQCLDQINVLRELPRANSEQLNGSLHAFREFNFSCTSADNYYQTLESFGESSNSLEGLSETIIALQSSLPAITNGPQVSPSGGIGMPLSNSCERELAAPVIDELNALHLELGGLQLRQTSLASEYSSAIRLVDEAFAGRDDSGITGCGPICRQRQHEAAQIASLSSDLEGDVAVLESALNEKSQSLVRVLQSCSSIGVFGIDEFLNE